MTAHPPKSAKRFGRDQSAGLFLTALALLLLALPAYALNRLSDRFDWRILAGVPVSVSILAYLAHRSDKRRAEAGARRIPESALHLAELAGGWPGALLAQRIYRHKTAKGSYQLTFWAIVLLHQFVAFDSLVGWRFTKDILHLIKTHPA